MAFFDCHCFNIHLDNFHGKHTNRMRNFMGDKKFKAWIHVCICKNVLSGYDGLMGSVLHCRWKQHISKSTHETLTGFLGGKKKIQFYVKKFQILVNINKLLIFLCKVLFSHLCCQCRLLHPFPLNLREQHLEPWGPREPEVWSLRCAFLGVCSPALKTFCCAYFETTDLCQSFDGCKILRPPVQHTLVEFFLVNLISLLSLPLFPLSVFVVILLFI